MNPQPSIAHYRITSWGRVGIATPRRHRAVISDSFKVTPKLTLKFGPRWDLTTVPRFKDGWMLQLRSVSRQVIATKAGQSHISPLYPSRINALDDPPS
jgi:hypothetical protein